MCQLTTWQATLTSLTLARLVLSAYRVAVYSSRRFAADALSRARATRMLITTPTNRKATNVTAYWVSVTRRLRYGGMKIMSNATTLRAAVNIADHRPQVMAAATTPMRYSITRLVGAR